MWLDNIKEGIEKTNDIAKIVESKPSVKPTKVIKDVTTAECELGIPPVSTNLLKLILLWIIISETILKSWTVSQAKTGIIKNL